MECFDTSFAERFRSGLVKIAKIENRVVKNCERGKKLNLTGRATGSRTASATTGWG